MPLCDQTGTPSGLAFFLHLRSSTISGSACSINLRTRESAISRQSSRSLGTPLLFGMLQRVPSGWLDPRLRQSHDHLGQSLEANCPSCADQLCLVPANGAPDTGPSRLVTPSP